MIIIPQKSSYLPAPFTMSDFTQYMKDSFSFMGVDVNQTSNLDSAFDSEYWIQKRKRNALNLAPETEQLVYSQGDFPSWTNNINRNKPVQGSEAYIMKNTDNLLPFSLYSVFEPRMQEADSYSGWRIDGVKSNTNYTVSFYARSPNGGGNMVVNAGSDLTTSPRSFLTNQTIGALSTSWTRYQFTVNTALNSSLSFHIGGWGAWSGTPKNNIARYTDVINSWSGSSATFGTNFEDSPEAFGYTAASTNTKADRVTFSGASSYVYTTSGLPSGTLANRTFTFSIYAKVYSGTPTITLTNGSSIISDAVPLNQGNNWYRYSVTYTFPAGATQNVIYYYINGTVGDTLSVWGAQVEEGAVPTNYFSNSTSTSYGSANNNLSIMWGDLHLSGLQIEEGSSATTYLPNTSWFYKELSTPQIYDSTLSNSESIIYYNIPPGVNRSFINARSSLDMTSYFGGEAVIKNPTSQNEAREFNHVSDRNSFGYNNGISGSNGSVNISGTYTICYPSDVLRIPVGPYQSNSSPMGNSYNIFGPAAGDANGVNYKFKVTVYGVVFRVGNTGAEVGSTAQNIRGQGYHIKTPGKGRRKFISTSIREDATNIYITQMSTLFQTNVLRGEAELEGFLIPTYAGEYTNLYTSGSTRSGVSLYSTFYSGGNASYTSNFIPCQEVTNAVTISKNTDLFSFIQGASDGFVYALNVNSQFVFHSAFADLVNNPFPLDNGTLFARHVYGHDISPSYSQPYRWAGHGPLMGDYSPTSGVNFRQSFYYSFSNHITSNPTSNYYEILGEDVHGTNSLNVINQVYAGSSSFSVASNRGQVKNFFMLRRDGFSGTLGDIMIGGDGSKYFNFSRYHPDTINTSGTSLFVKV